MTQSTKYLAALFSLFSFIIVFIFPQLQVLNVLSLEGGVIGVDHVSLLQFQDMCQNGVEYSFLGLGIHLVRICSYVETIYLAFQFLLFFSALLLVGSFFNILLSKEN